MASASSGAMVRTRTAPSSRFDSGTGTVLVVTTARTDGRRNRVTASPTSTPWLTLMMTGSAPAATSASAC